MGRYMFRSSLAASVATMEQSLAPRFDLALQVPGSFLQVLERVAARFLAGARDVFYGIAEAEPELPCLDDFYGLVWIAFAAVMGWMVDFSISHHPFHCCSTFIWSHTASTWMLSAIARCPNR
jgi:hypothetical protein